MTLTTVKISEIKVLDHGEHLIPVTETRSFKHIAKTLEKLDTGWKPKSKPQRRTKQIYDSIRIRGWNPERHGHIQTYQQGRHIVLWSGTHRLATLTHLGHTEATVQVQEKRYLRRGYW